MRSRSSPNCACAAEFGLRPDIIATLLLLPASSFTTAECRRSISPSPSKGGRSVGPETAASVFRRTKARRDKCWPQSWPKHLFFSGPWPAATHAYRNLGQGDYAFIQPHPLLPFQFSNSVSEFCGFWTLRNLRPHLCFSCSTPFLR
jgi:hypothetical protein